MTWITAASLAALFVIAVVSLWTVRVLCVTVNEQCERARQLEKARIGTDLNAMSWAFREDQATLELLQTVATSLQQGSHASRELPVVITRWRALRGLVLCRDCGERSYQLADGRWECPRCRVAWLGPLATPELVPRATEMGAPV